MHFWKMVNPIHIIKGWFYRITHKNKELVNKRLKICNTCKYRTQITKNIYVCSICWCELKAKASIKDEKCVIGKWKE